MIDRVKYPFDVVLFNDDRDNDAFTMTSVVAAEQWLRVAEYVHRWGMSWQHPVSGRKALIAERRPMGSPLSYRTVSLHKRGK